MKKILHLLFAGFIYFCVATVIAQSVGVGMFWWKGGFSGDRSLQLLAVLNGLDLHEFWTQVEQAAKVRPEEQVAYEDIVAARVKVGLDSDLREQAIQRAISELRVLESQLKAERASFEKVKKTFAESLDQQQKLAADAALQELQDTMFALAPKQAKEQIMLWLRNPAENYPLPGRDVVSDVVTLLKQAPLDRQNKIFKEFKTPEETERLHEILEKIRRGDKEELIHHTRDQLNNSAALGAHGTRK